MAKVRVLAVELEGADETVRTALANFIERFEAAKPVALPVAAPAAIPTPLLPEALAPVKAQKQGKRQKKTTPAAVAAVIPDSGAADAEVKTALQKKPMTSGELIKALPHRHPGTIYGALSVMRKQGVVETREDESTGEKKNYLK